MPGGASCAARSPGTTAPWSLGRVAGYRTCAWHSEARGSCGAAAFVVPKPTKMATAYEPLSDVRGHLRVAWYRTRVEPATLRRLMQRSDLQGWLQTGGHLLLYLATGALTFWLWAEQVWVAFALALFAHGTVTSFIRGVAPHELAHGTVFRTKWLNHVFLYFYSVLSWWDPFDYGTSHTYHHRYTLHPEGDRENLLPLNPKVGGPGFLIQIFTLNLTGRPGRTFGKGGLISTLVITFLSAIGRVGYVRTPAGEWVSALHSDQPAEARKSMWFARVQLAFHGAVAVYGIASGYWILPILVGAAPFIGNWLVYLVGLPQHCGLRDNVADFRKSTRSMKLDPLTTFLYWRMNWHTEHHMYAGIPCYNLKKLAREIAHDMPAPRTLLGAWREMRAVWKRQQTEPDYQFDTPVPNEEPAPAAARNGRPDGSGDLEASLGELAPQGLRAAPGPR